MVYPDIMSAALPVIKFSPFEALLIGEKNKVLKRQSMKNTVFLRNINQQRKKFNLRDLFDLDKNKTIPKNNDTIFKMPQRVSEFLKSRKFKSITKKSKNLGECKNKMYLDSISLDKTKNKNQVIKSRRGRKPKLKPNSINIKNKFHSKKKLDEKTNKNFKDYSRKRKQKQKILSKFLMKKKELKIKKDLGNRHLLRGKDGKFISRKEYEKLKSTKIIAKQNYISNYLHQLYLKKNKLFYSNNDEVDVEKNTTKFQNVHSLEEIIGLPKIQKKFDVEASESMLNEVSKMYHKEHCQEDFQFPEIPNSLTVEDFENNSYLLDILYEKFPKNFKFESGTDNDDFSEVLRHNNILKSQTGLKMYEKKKNGYSNSKKLTVIFNNHLPYIKISKLENRKPLGPSFDEYSLNGYSPAIDEPFTNKSHLITAKSFGSFFFRSAEGQEIFIGSILKPFIHNSWFGSLPEF